jgi:ABC-2 type transport system permease protein
MLMLFFFYEFSPSGNIGFAAILRYLSPLDHLESFFLGIIDLSNVVYFLSITTMGLYLTHRSLESIRWR